MYFVFLSCSSSERGVYAPNLRLKRCDALRGGHERIPELKQPPPPPPGPARNAMHAPCKDSQRQVLPMRTWLQPRRHGCQHDRHLRTAYASM